MREVLIVDDDLDNLEILSERLLEQNYHVTTQDDGEPAWNLLQENPFKFDVILLDRTMPVMDGFTCTEEVRKRQDDKKHIPIIAVTANLMDADKTRCIEAGMDDFLKKPIKLELLQSSLSHYLESVSP